MKHINNSMTVLKPLLPTFLLVLALTSCGGRPCAATTMGHADSVSAAAAPTSANRSFTLPQIPSALTSPEERAEYLAGHYWDNFPFADTTLISTPEITEQAFVNFIDLLTRVSSATADSALVSLICSASGNDAMFTHFIDLTEKYLYDPNSPLRNEEYYIVVLRYLTATPKLAPIDKIRPRHQLEMALKNRPGDIAADFTYTLADGRKGRLKEVEADYTILFFNNPDCHDCQRIKKFLEQEMTPDRYPEVTILAIYTDEDLTPWRRTKYPSDWINGCDREQVLRNRQLYDLKAIPTLYLLDRDKRVILKDAPAELIEAWLRQNRNTPGSPTVG